MWRRRQMFTQSVAYPPFEKCGWSIASAERGSDVRVPSGSKARPLVRESGGEAPEAESLCCSREGQNLLYSW